MVTLLISNIYNLYLDMDQTMHRLIRMIQTSSQRGFYAHARMARQGVSLHKRHLWAVPIGAAASVLCGGVLIKLKAEELKK